MISHTPRSETEVFNGPSVHGFQGRTVNTVIAATEAKRPNLTTQKSFYVEISRARARAKPGHR